MCQRYDCEFVETPPKEFECTICLNILKEPHLNNCCGQHFCQQCIQRIIDDQKPCPLCNKADFVVILDKKTERKILDLQVKCRKHQNGCDWVGELRSVDQHCDRCTYAEVDCPNSCGELVQRRLLPSHLEDKCSKRHINCAYCGHKSTHDDITTAHWPVCDRYPVACPNNCGKEGIPRCEVEEHRLKECPLQEIKCKYDYVGCETTLPRKEMDTHMETGMKEHLQLMERYTAMIKCEKESADNKAELMSKVVEVLQRELMNANQALSLKCNCTKYTVTVCNGRPRTTLFYPLYGPGYRMQLFIWTGVGEQMAVTIAVVGGRNDFNLTWPLKAIVTVELIDTDGSLEPISQSKRGIWSCPCRNETTEVAFDPFMRWARSNRYAKGSIQLLTFNVYLCQPEKHPEST